MTIVWRARAALWTFVFAFVALNSFSPSLYSQITGDLRGTVVDASGAIVPKATITLRSLETGETRSVVTVDGNFNFPLLRIGRYEVRAEAPGFRVATTTAEVKTGEIASVRFTLEVGQVTESVNVTDAVALLNTENAQIQTSVTGEAIQEIPVARNPNLFALTAPGVAPVSANNPFLGSGSFNSNGGRGRGNNITVDGITATDVSVTGTGGTLNPLNFSSIKEVKIITNNFSAEYGRNSSSQVLYITKSGTNELHGEVFEYFRNTVLNARPFFDTTGKANVVKRNEYGFAVGGPVYLPKLFDGRNKAFWFADYQGVKLRGAGATRIARVFTPEQVAGITDPTARALVQQYQVPTSPNGQITTSTANKTDFWQYALRGDFNLGSKDTLWMRYSQANNVSASDGLTFIGSNLPGFGATNRGRPRQATAAHTHLFGSWAVNEFRFGFGQSDARFPIDSPYPLGPRITFADGSINSFGVWEGLPQGREQRTYQFNDNFSFVRGSHNLKFGGEFFYLEADSFFDALQRPLLQFANVADFQRGVPALYQQRFGNSVRENRVRNFFAFAQDDWKVTRNLTLNLGLRMEWAGGPTERNGRISNLNLNNTTAYGQAGSGPFGLLEMGKPSFRSNTNWGPRFGFAWNVGSSGKTVIRGGYGIAYDFIFLNPITNQRFLPPLMVTGVLSGQASFTGANSLAAIVAGTSQIQRETAAQVGTLPTNVLNFGAISPAIDENLSNPQVHQFNLGVQREQFGIVWKASYVGTKGNFLQRSRDINFIFPQVRAATSLADETARLGEFQAAFAAQSGGATRRSNRIDPRYNAIVLVDSSANSNYHSFQFEAQKRISTLLFNAAYTFGKSIDDGSDVLGVLINDSATQQEPRDNRNNRAPSQFDLRQRLVITHSWEPAWFRGSSSWLLRNIVGNWGFSGITSFRSGFPITLEAGARRGLNPLTVFGGGGAVRPNASGPVNITFRPAGSQGAPLGLNNDPVQRISAYAESLGLSQPLLGNIGNLGRNVLRLNGERNFDWNIYKNFNVTERAKFQLRAEFYNIFNNTSFQEASRVITAPDFGQYNTVGQNARLIQLGARFVF
ncbi:MAG: carboxypeptidase regulatory-like domain-containing protein [Bryobacteraceae bacterium]|nr:carboxypeptidase regulatory-like domain-containing protein [Bryobacteraceae bacterium]MDW8380136.1 carboxypeptidase regulatory-like domain-containing protein [Bryobacterales bacterium]